MNERQTLAADHFYLVVEEARVYKSKLPKYIEYDDLVGYGSVGLMKAVDGFKPELASFPTYARIKIRGEMRNGVRGPEAEFGRRGAAKIIKRQFDSEEDWEEMNIEGQEKDPLEQVVAKEIWEKHTHVTSLESQLIVLIYRDGMTMTEIAARFKLSITRISQYWRQAMLRRSPNPPRWVVKRRERDIIPICAAADCDQPFHASGYCYKHYQRLVAHGGSELRHGRNGRAGNKWKNGSFCITNGCSGEPTSLGFCGRCYKRLWFQNSERRECVVEGCTNRARAFGKCIKHRRQPVASRLEMAA